MDVETLKSLINSEILGASDTEDFDIRVGNRLGMATLESWVETRGYDGGDCYGGDATPYTTGKSHTEFWALQKLLCTVCPEITLPQWLELREDLVKKTTHERRGWYGNRTAYEVWYVSLPALLRYLEMEDLV